MRITGTAQATITLNEMLQEFDHRLGAHEEPEILTLTEKKGFVSQRERFRKRLAIGDTSNYKVIGRYDIAFNPYLLWAGAMAQNTNWDTAIVSPLYPTFHVRDGYDPRFVDYVLRGDALCLLYDRISFGSVPRKRRAAVLDFLDLRVPQPPSLPEQHRIAGILDKVEALRAKRRAALALLDSLTQGIFFDMFGDPATNPRGWPRKSISEVGEVVTGNTPPRAIPEYYGSDIEWIKSDNINTPHYYLTRADEGLSAQGKQVARTVPAGSILVTCIAGSPDCIGNAAMTDREVAFNQQINALVPHGGDSHFLYVQLLIGKRLVQQMSTSSMKGMVSKSRFERIMLMFPPLPLQRQFSECSVALERLRSAHRTSLVAMDALFASLQYRAFRGEL